MKKTLPWLLLVLVLGGPAAVYLWMNSEKSQPQAEPAAAPQAEPAIRYPIESSASADDSATLPSLGQSDPPLRDALLSLFGQSLDQVFNSKDIVRRVVATMDNLPREHVSLRLMPVKPVTGAPVIERQGDNLVLGSANAARYGSYVRLAEVAPTAPLVALYVQFYPLFQEQYEELGYPGKYFNDRVVQVIDHLLSTPDLTRPAALTQPKVLYQFADPDLEALSAGQKILLRVGPENAAKLKAKLREIRSAIVSNAAAE
jgi:hypothetical protein